VRSIDGPPTLTPFDRDRFLRRVVVVGSLAVVAIQVVLYVVGWIANHEAIPLGLDWLGYRAGFDRLLATGTPYAAFELAGPFTPEHLDFIHPPNALVLFAPFAILPQPLDYILWIAIPIAIFCYLLRDLPWWAWPFVALLSTTNSLQYPILNGNSSLFMTAIFGLGFRYGWVVGLLAMKPTLAPLAIVGFRRSRRTVLVTAALAIVPILVTLPWFADYITVARNMQGIPLTYSISNYSLIALAALPWVAGKLPGWWARLRPARPAGSAPLREPA
jgi:Glycosyltransferase family 87